MANIVEYMRRTEPKTAREANPKSARNAIRKEAREHAQFLHSAMKTASVLGFSDAREKAQEDFLFLSRWFLKFGLKDED